eukprot:7805287-Ditylum_brightwellii.AAC.1
MDLPKSVGLANKQKKHSLGLGTDRFARNHIKKAVIESKNANQGGYAAGWALLAQTHVEENSNNDEKGEINKAVQ